MSVHTGSPTVSGRDSRDHSRKDPVSNAEVFDLVSDLDDLTGDIDTEDGRVLKGIDRKLLELVVDGIDGDRSRSNDERLGLKRRIRLGSDDKGVAFGTHDDGSSVDGRHGNRKKKKGW